MLVINMICFPRLQTVLFRGCRDPRLAALRSVVREKEGGVDPDFRRAQSIGGMLVTCCPIVPAGVQGKGNGSKGTKKRPSCFLLALPAAGWNELKDIQGRRSREARFEMIEIVWLKLVIMSFFLVIVASVICPYLHFNRWLSD